MEFNQHCAAFIESRASTRPVAISTLMPPKSLMPVPASVTIHPSQFPDQVREDLLVSFRTRRMNHKFHYDSIKQTNKWLALHQAYSPSRTDSHCERIYDESFAAVSSVVKPGNVHVIGLGCGGGQKDTRLLKLLTQAGRQAW